MRIVDHWLADPVDGIELTQVQARKGRLIVPELIIVHYAVTDSLDATVRAQQAQNYWAHLSIDGYKDHERSVAKVVQALPFNEMGSHAGKSRWREKSGCNGFSVGIEIANPGPLKRGTDGKLRTVYGKAWPEEQAVKTSRYGYDWWAEFTPEELDLCAHICTLLRANYPTIVDIRGHEEVAPGRKIDPGPAFPINWLRETVFPGGIATE